MRYTVASFKNKKETYDASSNTVSEEDWTVETLTNAIVGDGGNSSSNDFVVQVKEGIQNTTSELVEEFISITEKNGKDNLALDAQGIPLYGFSLPNISYMSIDPMPDYRWMRMHLVCTYDPFSSSSIGSETHFTTDFSEWSDEVKKDLQYVKDGTAEKLIYEFYIRVRGVID